MSILAGLVLVMMSQPNPQLTPGAFCKPTDPTFKGYYYDEQVALCERFTPFLEKLKVARSYGNIPISRWSQYEFDHLIPLCAGGSNNIENIWLQPINEAREKDKIEDHVCNAIKQGHMTQSQAADEIHAWFGRHFSSIPGQF